MVLWIFRGSATIRPGVSIGTRGLTQTMCKVALKSLTTPHLPSSAGNFRPLRVVAPKGSLFHAEYPAATFTLWSAIVGLELIYKALAQGMPDRLAASSGGDVPGFMMVGIHPVTERFFAVSNNDPVGWGATMNHDGSNATNHLSGSLVRNTPIESLELKTGMQVEKMEMLTDSGGAGKQRGGLGQAREVLFVSPGEFLSVMKKTKTKPWALKGGSQPKANRMILFPGSECEKQVGTHRIKVETGNRILNLTAGGGGYGDPTERDPKLVLEDVLDDYVSETAAREIYLVVIKNGLLDEEATQLLRSSKK